MLIPASGSPNFNAPWANKYKAVSDWLKDRHPAPVGRAERGSKRSWSEGLSEELFWWVQEKIRSHIDG